jgi:hypothetical protein
MAGVDKLVRGRRHPSVVPGTLVHRHCHGTIFTGTDGESITEL